MEQEEIWIPVLGFEEYYDVSSLGRIRNRISSHILGQFIGPKGYIYVNLQKNKKHYSRRIHRLVAIAFVPNPYNYPQVNHKDENPQNNHIDNLEWCTNMYNANYGNRKQRISKACKGIPKRKGAKPVSSVQQIEKHRGVKPGSHPSQETIARLRSSHIGMTASNETKLKMSASHKGRKMSDETKAKISAARMGIVFSEETRRKMSEAKKKR